MGEWRWRNFRGTSKADVDWTFFEGFHAQKRLIIFLVFPLFLSFLRVCCVHTLTITQSHTQKREKKKNHFLIEQKNEKDLCYAFCFAQFSHSKLFDVRWAEEKKRKEKKFIFFSFCFFFFVWRHLQRQKFQRNCVWLKNARCVFGQFDLIIKTTISTPPSFFHSFFSWNFTPKEVAFVKMK